MIENESLTNENKGLDVSLIVRFEDLLELFVRTLERSINIYIDFWRELLED
jgi:hypothetical protein